MLRLLFLIFIFGCSTTFVKRNPASTHACKFKIKALLDSRITVISEEKVTKKQQKELIQVIPDVDKIVEGYLTPPPPFEVKIYKHFDNAFWNPLDLRIETPYQFISVVTGKNGKEFVKKKHPRFTKYIISHEYGHAYFGFNFIRKPGEQPLTYELRKILEVMAKIENEVNKMVDELKKSKLFKEEDIEEILAELEIENQAYRGKLKRLLQSHSGSRTHEHDHSPEEFIKNYKDLKKQRENSFSKLNNKIMLKAQDGSNSVFQQKKMEIRGKLLELKSKYQAEEAKLGGFVGSPFRDVNEMFADVVAFFYSKDPEAIRDALHYSGSSEDERISAELRNFETEPSTTWKVLKQRHGYQYDKEVFPTGAASDYETLNPFRNYFYDHYLSQVKYRKNPGKTLQTLLLAMQDFVRHNLDDKDQFDYKKIQDVNRELVQFVEQRFSDY